MDCLFGVDGAPEAARRTRLKSAAPLIVFDKGCWHAEMRHRANATALAQEHLAKLGLADRDGMLQHSLEHWLQLTGRTTDNLKNLRGRGLLFQRLAELARARLYIVEQPYILDRDDGLIGEGFEQCDLLVRERPDLHPAYQDRA